jgi:GAF domain-containing protein
MSEPYADSDADIEEALAALLEGETDPIALAANTAALIFARVPDINWAGFYFLHGDTLVVGPFQGLPACTRIPLGRGVCGTAAVRRETIVVPDVHAFDGHIACDSASRSEIVVPLMVNGALAGVLDIDSPLPDRFGQGEKTLFEAVARIYMAACSKEGLLF